MPGMGWDFTSAEERVSALTLTDSAGRVWKGVFAIQTGEGQSIFFQISEGGLVSGRVMAESRAS